MTLQILNVITTASILYVVAAGLFVIFGVMNVINLAHAAFLLIGAYAALVVTNEGWSPWISFALAPAVGAALGAVIEFVVVRRLYRQPLDTILATWGLSIIITQAISIGFGRGVQFVNAPLLGAVKVGDVFYSKYRLLTIALAVGVGVGISMIARLTQWGLVARAVILNEELARGLGLDTQRVRSVTFAIGAGLAAFGGAALVPMFSVDPNLGIPWLVSAFMIVLVAGPSIVGLGLSALILGGSQTLSGFYIDPIVGNLAIVVFGVVLLRIFPLGFGNLTLRLFMRTRRS